MAAALGMTGVSPERRRRLAVAFTAFEAGMPLIGLAVGAPVRRAIGGAGDYVAIAVLLAFGLYTLVSSEAGEEDRLSRLGRVRGLGAVALGLSVSLDELAIGFTLGLLRLSAALVVLLIAVQAFVAAQLGLRLGARLGERTRERAERLAGYVLTGLGAFLLAEKLVG